MVKTREAAEIIGIKALTWLAGNDELMPVFMGASGAAVDDFRQQASDPAFLGSVLDFLLMDDAWIMAFCDAENLKYDEPMRARAALPGGEQINWT